MTMALQKIFVVASIVALLCLSTKTATSAFTLQPTTVGRHVMGRPNTALGPLKKFLDAMTESGEKYFQLEEREDSESCSTEVYVKSDYTLRIGETNGPRCTSSVGVWKEMEFMDEKSIVNNEGIFEMEITRTYETGQDGKSKWGTNDLQMGKFEFTVQRRFNGEFQFVGAEVNVAGTIVDVDPAFGDRQVGYFSMIDVTKDRAILGMEGSNMVS